MARDYFFAFGAGQPSTFASLAPTFIIFVNAAGSTFAAPSIAEKFPGSGLYYVSYGATQTMAFVLDGATTGMAAGDRYISGVFDPYDQFGVTLNAAYALGVTGVAIGTTLIGYGVSNIALGTSNIALGTSILAQGVSLLAMGTSIYALGASNAFAATMILGAIGTTASSYGSTAIDPGDLFGYLKRARELAEGNQTYTKATGLLDLYVRGGSTLLIEKTIADSSVSTTKT